MSEHIDANVPEGRDEDVLLTMRSTAMQDESTRNCPHCGADGIAPHYVEDTEIVLDLPILSLFGIKILVEAWRCGKCDGRWLRPLDTDEHESSDERGWFIERRGEAFNLLQVLCPLTTMANSALEEIRAHTNDFQMDLSAHRQEREEGHVLETGLPEELSFAVDWLSDRIEEDDF